MNTTKETELKLKFVLSIKYYNALFYCIFVHFVSLNLLYVHKNPQPSYDLGINWRTYESIHNVMSFLYNILNY